MTRYGIWAERPGKWTGWFGFACDDVFVPMTFEKDEAETRAARCMGNEPDARVEVRPNPPAELPWNEAEWKRAIAA